MKIQRYFGHLALTTGVAALTFAVAAGVLQAAAGIELPPNDPEELLSPVGGLLMLILVLVGLSTWIAHRSRFEGRQLTAQIFVVLFGVMFFMSQIETLAFNDAVDMPWQMVAATTAAGLLVCLVVAAMGTRLRRRLDSSPAVAPALVLGRGALFSRFSILAVLYTVLYFVFGYYIAWQFPAVREFYSGSTTLVSFGEQMGNVLAQDSWLIPFQLVRGYAWAAIAYVLIMGLSATGRIERYLLVGLAMSLPLAVPLLVPQGYMPMAVRIGHSSEVFLENFLFGCAVVAMLQPTTLFSVSSPTEASA